MIPTNTSVTLNVTSRLGTGVEALAVFAAEGSQESGVENRLGEEERFAIQRLLRSGIARGKAREVQIDLIAEPSRARPPTSEYRRVLVVGLGPAQKVTAETLRQSAGALARAVRRYKLQDIVVAVPPPMAANVSSEPATAALSVGAIAEAIATGFLLASFHYGEFKGTGSKAKANGESESKDEELTAGPKTLTLLVDQPDAAGVRAAMARAKIIADGQNFARTIASRPGNIINPPALAKVAQQMARETGLRCRVLDEKQMARLGMGGILAVGRGSATPPRMIVLEHLAGSTARAGVRPLLVVGKSITFDTGGVSIKGADKMGRMIFDKCGGMAVLGFMYAAAKLKLPVPIVGILTSRENHLAGTAYRPGDILKMYNGVTVEVTNTDAEGRLVLSDALAWGIEQYKPSAVIDLATLTGGVVTALGHTMAGVMANDDALVADLITAGRLAGEQIWRLPLGEDQRQQIKSDAADIVNSAGRPASPLQGAAFLSYFVPPKLPWAHLDIAGVADIEKDLPYYARGATGWGVRTLLNWAEQRSPAAAGNSRKPVSRRKTARA